MWQHARNKRSTQQVSGMLQSLSSHTFLSTLSLVYPPSLVRQSCYPSLTDSQKPLILSPCRNCLLHLSLLNCFQVRWNLSSNRIRPGAPVHLMSLEGFLHHSGSLGILEFWLSSTNKRQKGSTTSLRPCSASLQKKSLLLVHMVILGQVCS